MNADRGKHRPLSTHLMAVNRRELTIGHTPDEPELALIVDRARRGSAEAFDELARHVRERVRGWAAHITGDVDDAEDVAQIVLLRIRDKLHQFEGQSRFTTWLFRITRSVAVSRRRKAARRSQLLEERGAELVPGVMVDPGRQVEEAERARMVRLAVECLAELPSRQREVFEMADLGGLSSAEIAARLGIDAVTVRVHLLKARRAIRTRMLAEHPRLMEELE